MSDPGEEAREVEFHALVVGTLRSWDVEDDEDSITDEILEHHRVVFGGSR